MYYNNCRICKSYSWGNELCYKCYQEEMNKFIEIINTKNNKCIKCNQTIKEILYCRNCYKKHTPITVKEALEKYRNIYTEKRKAESQKDGRKAIFKISETAQKFLNMDMSAILDTPKYYPYSKVNNISTRKCTLCDKNAIIGSYYCEEHKGQNQSDDIKTNIYYDKSNDYIYTFELDPMINKMFDTFSKGIKKESKDSGCIICGKPSNNKPYCLTCYKKTRKKSITSFDQNGKKYKCKNGIYVRSKSERTISDFLTDHNIPHEYEKPISIDSKKEHDIHPDFYIPGIITYKGTVIRDIYLEHWGYDINSKNYYEYKKQNEYKANIYKKMGLTVVYTTEKDMINPEESLKKKLLNIKINHINDWPI